MFAMQWQGYERKRVEVEVKIPAGIQSGQQLRVPNKGERGTNGGPNGDLFIEIIVSRHEFFTREGRNIYINIPISSVDATLGCTIEVPTVYGDVELTVPAGTQNNTQFRLKGKGVKSVRSGRKGDLYVTVNLEVPTNLNSKQKKAIKAMAEEVDTECYNKKKGFLDSLKEFFS